VWVHVRLSASLASLRGVGPRRVEALGDHFGTLWALRHASVEEIAAVPGVPRALAERISSAVR
jgi:excinuclease ABC subunit C